VALTVYKPRKPLESPLFGLLESLYDSVKGVWEERFILERSGTVVTDDRAARKVCREPKVSLTGTMGILVASVRDSLLTQIAADEVLQAMMGKGFHSPVRRISDIIRK
jgi:hypothetical protein